MSNYLLEEPAAKPIEKTILWRVAKLLVLNIKLIFVFDGPRRPHKRGRPAGFIPYEKTDLLKKTLRHFKVPYHQAPAEAEAECAVLQREGIVDAAWSEDGDALMFGCELLITNYCEAGKGGRKRLSDKVSIYRAEDILQKHDFNQQSFVLFAMLSGGDYNDKGLPNCGPKTAYKVCKRQYGLADSLCRTDQWSFAGWTSELRDGLRGIGKYVEIPPTFPDYKTLVKYRDPVISTQYELRQRREWESPIMEKALRPFLRETFNIWTRGYVKHVCPILLVQNLVKTRHGKSINDAYEVRPRHKRKTKKSQEEPENPSCKLITFNALAVSSLDLKNQPPEEDWSVFKTKGEPEGFDPAARVECELPITILRQAILDEVLNGPPPAPSSRKRKTNSSEQADGDEAEQPKKKRKRRANQQGDGSEVDKPKQSRKNTNTTEELTVEDKLTFKPKRTRKQKAAATDTTLASVEEQLPSVESPPHRAPTKLATFRRPGERPLFIFDSSLETPTSPTPSMPPTTADRPASTHRSISRSSPRSKSTSDTLPLLTTAPPSHATQTSPHPPSPQTLRMLRIQAFEARTARSLDPSPTAAATTNDHNLPASLSTAKPATRPSPASSMRSYGAHISAIIDLDWDNDEPPRNVSKPVSKAAVAASILTTGVLPALANSAASATSKAKAPVDVVDLT